MTYTVRMYDPYRPPPPPPAPTQRKGFWTRPKVAGASLVLGLLIGVAPTGGETDEPSDEAAPAPAAPTVTVTAEPSSEAVPSGLTQDDLDRAVDNATARGDARARRMLAAQRTKAVARIRAVRRQARTDRRAAVRSAVRQARAQSGPPVEVPVVETPPVEQTDPQFSYCYEANDAGYGNYVSGVDPEYDWYDDADGDGRVCEF